jgi:hypothetical protein
MADLIWAHPFCRSEFSANPPQSTPRPGRYRYLLAGIGICLGVFDAMAGHPVQLVERELFGLQCTG